MSNHHHDFCTRFQCRWLFILGVILGLSHHAFAGQYVKVSPDLDIYYEEAGTGDPIILNPGWTGTTEYLRPQFEYFSKNYHVISYDPRGQGRSSKTLENNNYTQHGHDLKALLDALELKDVILIGHSWGCHDIYSYFRSYGVSNVKAFICIDSPPKTVIENEGDWGWISSVADMRGAYQSTAYHRLAAIPEFIQSLVNRPLTAEEKNWWTDQLMKNANPGGVVARL